MTMNGKRPILVTGSHRSGTTWVGKMLALSPNIFYIHEPFNPLTRPGICAARFPRAFTYITRENATLYEDSLRATLERRYSFRNEWKTFRAPRDIGRMMRDSFLFSRSRSRNDRPLMKDPLALFSAEWLAETFDMQVVVMIRHPAAFVASLKNKDWRFDFNNFLEQPLLMRDHLSPFEEAIRGQVAGGGSLIDQAILLWRIIHQTILGFRERHSDWVFLRHEDLSREPAAGFEFLFSQLNLNFLDEVRATITRHTSDANPAVASGDTSVFEVRRDSRANIFGWKKRLSEEAVDRVRTRLADIWPRLYSEQDW